MINAILSDLVADLTDHVSVAFAHKPDAMFVVSSRRGIPIITMWVDNHERRHFEPDEVESGMRVGELLDLYYQRANGE